LDRTSKLSNLSRGCTATVRLSHGLARPGPGLPGGPRSTTRTWARRL